MNIYRNKKTKRLVLLYRVSPRHVLGSHYQEEDFFTKVTANVKNNAISRVGTKTVINPHYYELVATQ